MGIKNLNRFLRTECKESIKITPLVELSGKKIVIDISIYLFKYAAENCLIENIYLMLSVFRHYNIIPVFVFDGKTPTEKKELVQRRREDKLEAEKEYQLLQNKLDSQTELDETDNQEIHNNMDLLKKKFIYISKADFENVKKLITAFGATYYDAPGEADELCAMLTIKGKVWACVSEDMDMFVYGCTRVIRYLSLLNHTTVLYEQKGLLSNLGITQKELSEICILSGTDYNLNENSKNKVSLHNTLKLFKKYKKHKQDCDFYTWLMKNTNYIEDYELLMKINSMFNINESKNLKVFEKLKIVNGQINMNEIKEILKQDGFIFPK